MTGIGLGVIHIRLVIESADLRQAIGADTDHAAPLIVDLHVSQLWKDFEHFRPHVRSNVFRIAS
ncbi:hypothetical protein D3C81_2292190 [compost metagenome]